MPGSKVKVKVKIKLQAVDANAAAKKMLVRLMTGGLGTWTWAWRLRSGWPMAMVEAACQKDKSRLGGFWCTNTSPVTSE